MEDLDLILQYEINAEDIEEQKTKKKKTKKKRKNENLKNVSIPKGIELE